MRASLRPADDALLNTERNVVKISRYLLYLSTSNSSYAWVARQDGDWDGKTVRLVHFFVRGMVTVQGDTEGRALGSQWEGRGITEAQILQAIECFR